MPNILEILRYVSPRNVSPLLPTFREIDVLIFIFNQVLHILRKNFFHKIPRNRQILKIGS